MDNITRPWGTFRIIERGVNYKIKQLVVCPHCRTSLQFHRFRSEDMIIIQGTLNIFKGKEFHVFHEGENCHIEIGQLHRLQNDSDRDVSIIEVQFGHILEENDIVRIEDDYGRL